MADVGVEIVELEHDIQNEDPDVKKLRGARTQAARKFTEKYNSVVKAQTKDVYDPNTVIARLQEAYEPWDKLLEAQHAYVNHPLVNYDSVAVN